jgi:transcription initiation factor IIE alpha subunit
MDPQPKLTKVAKIVLKGLEEENRAVKPEELVQKLGINLRSIRYGLKLLQDAHLIVRQPDLIDLRSFYYSINGIQYTNAPISIEA